MSENDFECLASAGVNAPETMVRLESAVTRFSDADFWQDIREDTLENNYRFAHPCGTLA